MRRRLAAFVGLSAGCALFGDGDVPARVTWLEAAIQSGELRLRVIGHTGCGGIAALDTKVFDEGTVPVVHVFARATKTDALCVRPNRYDSTIALSPPPARNFLAISAGGSARRSDVHEFFLMRLNEPNVEAFAGGSAVVEGAEEGCPQIRVQAAGRTRVVYAIELLRDVELFDGDFLTLDGAFFEGVRSFCSEHRALRVNELTLSAPPPP